MEDLKQKVKSGFIWESSTKLAIQILSWISTILVARWLTPDDYGIVAVSGVFVVFCTVVAEMGLTSGLVNKKEISDTEVNGVFWLGVVVSVALTITMIVLSPYIEKYCDMPGLGDIISVASLVFIIISLRSVPTALVLRELNYKYQAVVGLMAQFVQVTSVLFLAYNNFGAWSLVYSTLLMQLVMTVAYFPQTRGVRAFAIQWQEIREVVIYGNKVMASTVMNTLTELSPSFLIGIILGQKSAGIFSMASQLGKIPLSKIGVVFNRVLFPAVSRISEDINRSCDVFLRFHRVLLMSTFPILAGTALISHDLVLLLFTEKWIEIVPIIQIICVLNLIQVSSMVMSPMLTGLGMPNAVVRYNLMLLVLIPAASVIGLQWGMIGMLVSWGVVYPVSYLYLLLKLKGQLGFGVAEFLNTTKSVVASTFMMVIVLLYVKGFISHMEPFAKVVVLIASGAGVYGGMYFLFFRHELQELLDVLRAK